METTATSTRPPAEQRIQRAERAMAQAFWNLEMAERRHQPAQVLDQMEARYFTALHAYEHEMKQEMRGGGGV